MDTADMSIEGEDLITSRDLLASDVTSPLAPENDTPEPNAFDKRLEELAQSTNTNVPTSKEPVTQETSDVLQLAIRQNEINSEIEYQNTLELEIEYQDSQRSAKDYLPR